MYAGSRGFVKAAPSVADCVPMAPRITERRVRDMRFRCREAGTRGEPVLLLHGFPETSAMWSDLLGRLETAGYRCLAPDQRGYSPGARPEAVESYALAELAADAIALADDAGFERFHLVGHDWGAACGWAVAELEPERVQSWSALSVPHLEAFRTAIQNDGDQAKRSGYVQMFRQQGVAEEAMSADDFAVLRGLWASNSEETIEDYLAVFRQPGALTAALNWYRSDGLRAETDLGRAPVSVPTLFVWGANDPAIGRVAAEGGAGYASGPYRFVELDVGHWIAQEAPDELADQILGHLRKYAVT